MKVTWIKAPRSAQEIIEALQAAGASCHPKTVKTYLNRLVKKRVLTFQKLGRTYKYRPAVSEAECVDAACQAFIAKFAGRSLKLMLQCFIRDLSPSQIHLLKTLLPKK